MVQWRSSVRVPLARVQVSGQKFRGAQLLKQQSRNLPLPSAHHVLISLMEIFKFDRTSRLRINIIAEDWSPDCLTFTEQPEFQQHWMPEGLPRECSGIGLELFSPVDTQVSQQSLYTLWSIRWSFLIALTPRKLEWQVLVKIGQWLWPSGRANAPWTGSCGFKSLRMKAFFYFFPSTHLSPCRAF